MAKTFPARFGGECSRCGESFDEDDPIGYDEEDELCCEGCIEEDEAELTENSEDWKGFLG